MALPSPARGARGPGRVRNSDPLIENFYELWRRSYGRAELQRPGGGLQVYRACAAHLFSICGESWGQATVFGPEADLSRRFLAESRLEAAVPETVAHFIFANVWARIWTGVLLKVPAAAFNACCGASDIEPLKDARGEGKGIILLHSHTVFTQIYWRWAEHANIDPGLTLWQWTWNQEQVLKEDAARRAVEGTKELLQATGLLRKGGIVHVLADGGRTGGSQIELPFLGRRRKFQPTFAELAVSCGVPVLTADVTVAPDGRISIEIGPQLADDPKAGRKERVSALVAGYCRHLERRWSEHPGNLPWRQLGRYFEMPPL